MTYLVKSSSHLLKEMKKAVENNGAFYTDFCSGNIEIDTVSWKSDNLVCFLPEYWKNLRRELDVLGLQVRREIFARGLKYKVNDPENLLTKEMLTDHSLELKNYICFRDEYKRRLQLLAQVVKI